MIENLFWLGFVGAALALVFALIQRNKVMAYSEGTDTMKKIAQSIRDGANAYLKHQYTTVAKVFVVVFIVLLIMAFATGGEMLSKFTPFAFLTGGIWSMLAGFIGMKIATNSNARTAQAASESLNRGLRVAFSSGSVMGFTVVGLGLLDISIWYFLLRYVFGVDDPVALGNIMVMNGMGASFMALFARVGGGIYTKAADVGADLVGKVEAGIPEDDPRNPATIADNVGDNVGDVAGSRAAGCVRRSVFHPRLLPGQNQGECLPAVSVALPAHWYLYCRNPVCRSGRPSDLLYPGRPDGGICGHSVRPDWGLRHRLLH